jgi:hypothetical protein
VGEREAVRLWERGGSRGVMGERIGGTGESIFIEMLFVSIFRGGCWVQRMAEIWLKRVMVLERMERVGT